MKTTTTLTAAMIAAGILFFISAAPALAFQGSSFSALTAPGLEIELAKDTLDPSNPGYFSDGSDEKCGEGKCGDSADAKCGDEGNSGEAKCGDGSDSADAKCGDGSDSEEAKCGEGKCGGE